MLLRTGQCYLAHYSTCLQSFSGTQGRKNEKTIKETTEKNHESIKTYRLPIVAGSALPDCVANDRSKNCERRKEREGHRLKDGVSSNDSKHKEDNCARQTDCQRL